MKGRTYCIFLTRIVTKLWPVDVRNLAHKMEINRDKLPAWPSDRLLVYAEHSSLFYDIMTDQMADQAWPNDP